MSKALLLIHGFLTGTDDWDFFLPELGDGYDRVEVFRQPGHARADEKPCYKEFTVRRTYEELDNTLTSLAPYDGVDIVGHSMGGGMALYAAAKLPNAHRVVAISPALKYPRFGFVTRKNRVIRKLRRLAEKGEGELAEALTASADRVAAVYKEGATAFKKRLFPHWSRHNLMTFVRIMKRAKKCVKDVRCPLTVIWGELDEFVPRSSPESIMRKAGSRDKQFVVYGDMGHGMLYERNASLIVRDVKAALGGENLDGIAIGKAELRTVRKVTSDGRTVCTVTSRHGVKAIGGKPKETVSSETAVSEIK